MNFNISLKNLRNNLKSENIKLTNEERETINTIWSKVDLYDEEGCYKSKGDGKLNSNEWVLFKTELMKNSEILYKKLTSFINDTNSQIEYTRNYNLTSDKVFDSEKYKIETLKEIYPEKIYVIEEKEEENGLKSVIVTNKNGKEILKIERDSFGNSKIIYSNYNGSKYIYSYDNSNRIIKEETSEKYNEYIYKTKISAMYDYNLNLKYEGNNVYDAITGRLVSTKADGKETFFNEDGSYEEIDLKTGIKTYYDKDKTAIKSELCKSGFDAAIGYVSNEESEKKFDELINKLLETDDIYAILQSHRSINILTDYLEELKTGLNDIYEINPEKANELSKKILDKLLADAEKKGVYTDDLKSSFEEIYDSNMTLYFKTYEIKRLIARVEGDKSEPTKFEPNGKIEKNSEFSQGIVGNCWLIADLKSIINCNNDNALEKLNELITVQKDEDGNIISETVKIQGKEYVIPYEEIKGAEELSSGDPDVRAIELAVYKYLDEINMDNRAIGTGLTQEDYFYDGNPGGTSGLGLDILFGNGGQKSPTGRYLVNGSTINIDNKFIERLQSDDALLVSGCTDEAGFFAKNIKTDENVEIAPDHAYTILSIQNDVVCLQNPMDSNSEILEMSLNDFQKCFKQGSIYNLS